MFVSQISSHVPFSGKRLKIESFGGSFSPSCHLTAQGSGAHPAGCCPAPQHHLALVTACSCLIPHPILSPFLCKHLSRSLWSCLQFLPQHPRLQIRWGLQLANHFQLHLSPEAAPSRDRQLRSLSGEDSGENLVYAARKEAVAGLQTSGKPPIECTALMTAEDDYRPKKIGRTGPVCATLCPAQGRTRISACQHVSSANNKLFARMQHLPSPLSPFLQQSTLLAKHAQQILGQIENKTLETSSPALHLWPQNWDLGAHAAGFSTLASPSPALGCKAGQGVLTPAWLPAAAFPELGRSGRLAGRCYPTPAWFLLPFQAGRAT